MQPAALSLQWYGTFVWGTDSESIVCLMNSNQQLHRSTEGTVPMARDTTKMEVYLPQQQWTKMPKYSQVSLAIQTALVLHGIPPFQWVFNLITLSNQNNKTKKTKAKPPQWLYLFTSQLLIFSIKAPLGCWTLQMFSRAEYWHYMRYSRFLFATGGWLVLGSLWQAKNIIFQLCHLPMQSEHCI